MSGGWNVNRVLRAQSSALSAPRASRVSALVAHLSGPVHSVSCSYQFPYHLPSLIFMHSLASLMCHSHTPSAPVLLTSSILHIFITEHPQC